MVKWDVNCLEYIVAKYSGYCFGVKNAMEKVEELIDKKQKANTIGPVIHNPQEVERLKGLGIVKQGNVIIRTHGVGSDICKYLESLSLNIIDCTCPFVKRIHKLVDDFSNKGLFVIIIGNHNHPEVEGIKGWCKGQVKVIENIEEAKNFYTNQNVGIVVQTTQTQKNLEDIMDILESKLNISVFHNTRCKSTIDRQNSAAEVASIVDIMLVIGGKKSSNTKKLAQVCQNVGTKVYHIETSKELKKEWLLHINKVGITAGASTPDWIIKEVISKMEELSKDINEQEIAANEEEGELDYDNTITSLEENSIVEGIVAKVDDNEVLVNIGYKSDGVIPIDELSNEVFEKPQDLLKVGDNINVYIIDLEDKNGDVILSKKKK